MHELIQHCFDKFLKNASIFQACVIYQLSDGNIVYQHGASSTSLESACTKNQTELKALITHSFHIGTLHILRVPI